MSDKLVVNTYLKFSSRQRVFGWKHHISVLFGLGFNIHCLKYRVSWGLLWWRAQCFLYTYTSNYCLVVLVIKFWHIKYIEIEQCWCEYWILVKAVTECPCSVLLVGVLHGITLRSLLSKPSFQTVSYPEDKSINVNEAFSLRARTLSVVLCLDLKLGVFHWDTLK